MTPGLAVLFGAGALAVAALSKKKPATEPQAVKFAADEAAPIAQELVWAGVPPAQAATQAVSQVEQIYAPPAPPPPPPIDWSQPAVEPPSRTKRERPPRPERPQHPRPARPQHPKPEREQKPKPEIRRRPIRIQESQIPSYKGDGWTTYRKTTGSRTHPRVEYWAFPPEHHPDQRSGAWTPV